MAKRNYPVAPTKRVFSPTLYAVDIGDNEYTIGPQPLANIVQFDDVVKDLSSAFDDLADKFYVTDTETGDDVAGSFDKYDDAQAHIDETKLEGVTIRVEGVSIRELLDRLVSSPYAVLKPLIPDLKEEDAREISFPQIQFLFKLLIEVNGFGWFEKLLKNLVEPLLPRLADLTAGAFSQGVQGALKNFTVEGNSPGEKP